MKILIIGYGVVGKNIGKEMKSAGVPFAVSDPGLGLSPPEGHYDIAFVCVPTDSKADGSADTSIVFDAISLSEDRAFITVGVYVIKSTVPPGTTRILRNEFRINAVFSPEYYGGTQHANTPHPFLIVGGEKGVDNVVEFYKGIYTGYVRILKTTFETAELIKYAENTWLAMQVTFFNEFFRIGSALGIDNDVFREGLLMDERISRSHSFVYLDHPYYDSHCLNKDIPALIAFCNSYLNYEPEFVEAIKACNDTFKKGE